MGVHEFVPSCIEHSSKAKTVDSQVATLLPGWVQSDSRFCFRSLLALNSQGG